MSTEHGAGAAWSPAGSMALASCQPLRSITQSHSVYHTHRLGPAPGGAEGRACGEVGEAQGRERENFLNNFIAITTSGSLLLLGTVRNCRVGLWQSFPAAHNTREMPFLKVSTTSIFCLTSGGI